MGAPKGRKAALRLLKEMRRRSEGSVILGVGTGMGLVARSLEGAGADFIAVYNACHWQLAGRGLLGSLLPYDNANEQVEEMLEPIVSVVKSIPVVAGVCASDPKHRLDDRLDKLKQLGVAGVINAPTVGFIDGTFRDDLESTGMGFDAEVRLIRAAREKDLLGVAFVFSVDETRQMLHAGADVIIAHMGLQPSVSKLLSPTKEDGRPSTPLEERRKNSKKTNSLGTKRAKSLPDACRLIGDIFAICREINPEVIVLAHGGPIRSPEDSQAVLTEVTGLHGFYGPHSIERATSASDDLKKTTVEFKMLRNEVLSFI